jgi:predicted aldo/keto reductase-like oxidoreductase
MSDQRAITRREFFRSTAGALTAATLAPRLLAGQDENAAANGIPTRPLGATGEKVAILGLGGHHIGRIKQEKDAVRLIRSAIDEGVTFMDNAWEYHGGRSERLMGQALTDGYRKKAFLMTKHHGRKSKKKAMEHLEDSLRRLKTDVIDLWQFHEVVYEDDPRMIFSAGGGLEAAVQAKKQGKVRFVGFTGHKTPELLLEMLEHDFHWDAAQFPVNPIDPHYKSFLRNVLPVCRNKKTAVLAMKTMAAGFALKSDKVTAEQCLRFAWSQPVATIISGIDNQKHLKQNIEMARNFKPMTQEEIDDLLARTRPVADGGKYEPFKVGLNFNGRQGRLLHGKPVN